MLWFIFVGLAVAASIFMALPLRSRSQAISERNEASVAIFADQLSEVEADAERGLISQEDAQAAQIEIKRRLLALSRKKAGAGLRHVNRDGRAVLWVATIAVPLAAAALYAQLGSPDVPAVAFAERESERAQQSQITELTGKLLERLQSDPEGGPTEGWILLAQTYMRMGRYGDAALAMENVIDRADATSPVLSQYAEALVAAEDGIVTPKAREVLRRARAMDPANPAASFYEAIALDQEGDSDAAHDLLVSRLESADEPAPWMEVFIAQANRIGETIGREPVSLVSFAPMAGAAAPGPTESDVSAAAEMSEEDRAAFIRSMVNRLAERLTETPDDLDGWLRLANAYRVLGEVDNARDAYRTAERLAENLPPEDPRSQTIQRALTELDG